MSGDKPRTRLLVTGATGCVGSAVLRLTRADDRFEVWGLTRDGNLPSGTNARPVVGDLGALSEWIGELPPMHSCIHAAAAVHGSEQDPARVALINHDLTIALAEGLAARGSLKRFVFVSSVAAGARDGEPDDTPYARSKASGEVGLNQASEELEAQVATVRLATVYGPGDRGNIGSLFDSIRRGRYLRIASPNVRKSLVWAESAAAALLAAADPQVAAPALSVVADPEPYELSAIEDALAKAAGVRPPRRLWAPAGWALAATGSLIQTATRRSFPITLSRLRTLALPNEFKPGPPGPIQEAAAKRSVPLLEGFQRSYAEASTQVGRL